MTLPKPTAAVAPPSTAVRRTGAPAAPGRRVRDAPLDRAPAWEVDGVDWPNRAASRFVEAAGLCWHVQRMGHGPALLLLHGTGAATHTWRDLAPALAGHFSLLAPDLPGHGFTGPMAPSATTLPGLARALAALLQASDFRPRFVLGHSAGAALAVRLTLDRLVEPRALVGLNAALLPFDGLAGLLYAPLARALASGPLAPRVVAWLARDPGSIRRLVDTTGSTLGRDAMRDYGRLLRSPAHVAGVLRMLAGWDLEPLARELPRLAVPLWLLAGERDRTVPPEQSRRIAARAPTARVIELPGLGHLAHEEQPHVVASRVRSLLLDGATPHGPT